MKIWLLITGNFLSASLFQEKPASLQTRWKTIISRNNWLLVNCWKYL